jgi:hypothetical protein
MIINSNEVINPKINIIGYHLIHQDVIARIYIGRYSSNVYIGLYSVTKNTNTVMEFLVGDDLFKLVEACKSKTDDAARLKLQYQEVHPIRYLTELDRPGVLQVLEVHIKL